MLIYGDPNIAVWQILHLYSPATQSINRAFRAGDPPKRTRTHPNSLENRAPPD